MLTLLGAIWGLMTATRWLRGEDEAGRWELLLAGQTTRLLSVIQGIAALAAGWLALWAMTAALVLVAGLHVDPPLSPSDFLYFVIRMVADSDSSFAWARWASPLGWVEELQPLTGAQPLVLLPMAALAGAMIALAVILAGKRDLDSGVIPASEGGGAHLGLMTGPAGLAVRLARPVAAAWMVAMAVVAGVGGLMAKSVANGASSTVGVAFGRLGAAGIDALLGVIFLLLAVILVWPSTGATWSPPEDSGGSSAYRLSKPFALTWESSPSVSWPEFEHGPTLRSFFRTIDGVRCAQEEA